MGPDQCGFILNVQQLGKKGGYACVPELVGYIYLSLFTVWFSYIVKFDLLVCCILNLKYQKQVE